MTWTYSGDPASTDNDAIRFLVGDTVSTDPLVENEEIAFALAQRGSTSGAAATICRSLAAKFAREADTHDDRLSTSHSQRSNAFRRMAEDYEEKAALSAGPAILVAGIPSSVAQQ